MLTSILAVVTLGQTPDIDQFVQPAFKDATFVAEKVMAKQRELDKINSDFGQSYKFDKIKFFYKEPLKLRLEAQVDDTRALYIINGTTQAIKVPRLRVNVKQDLSKAPGRRQTPLDFGVLTPGMFRNYLQAKFVRYDRATNNPIFDLTYQYKDDTSRHRIWIDRDQKYVVKREWYAQEGHQRATFFYEKPMKSDGVWFPTQMTVKNVEDKVAGITRYDSIKINTGLDDDLFKM